MFERFSEPARRVLVLAHEEARALNHHYIGTEHLLMGLAGESEGTAGRALESLGVGVERVRDQVREIIGQGVEPVSPSGHIPFTPRSRIALELAQREADERREERIGTEHVLLAILREGQSVAVLVLNSLDAEPEQVRAAIERLLDEQAHPSE